MGNRTIAREPGVPAGHAASGTSEGTRRYASRFAERYADDFFRAGPGGLSLSSLGIGTYLGDCSDAEDARYADVIRKAIGQGVNVVDTAINYRHQRSERAIGEALRRAFEHGEARRDELVICSKGGYIPLDREPLTKRAAYEQFLRREFYEPGVMTPDDVVGGGHSLAPGFLRYCIAKSRNNLGIRSIELYYLHNPETQLPVMAASSFRERMRAAFMVLEDAVSRGDIGGYGCATWSALRSTPESRGHLSLRDLVALAREVAGDGHHFRAVQLPINLAMAEAVRVPTQTSLDGTLVSVLDAAQELGLAVVASAPLMQ
ncbi:MAG TPA: aldo/keto reductase, partial [Gemmatimonadaceae bacterium]|nr:aldo/keto reductase [Gemmatimonadaceae bacterium]